MQAKAKSYLFLCLKILVAVALITWLVRSDRLNFKEMKGLLHPGFISLGLCIIGFNIFCSSERWRGILRSQGFAMKPWETLRLTLIGLFFNFAIPGGVGGDVIKGYYVVRNHPENQLRAVVTIAMDRLLGLFSMLLMALFVMIYDWQRVSETEQLFKIFLLLFFLFCGFMLFWVLIYSRRLVDTGWPAKIISKFPRGQRLMSLYGSFADYKDAKRTFFRAILWSLVSQSAAIMYCVFVGSWLGYGDVSIHTYFFVVPIGFMVTAIPISPAGVGVGQAAFAYLFDLALNRHSNLGASTITAVQITNFTFGLWGAYFYLRMGKKIAAKAWSQ